MGKRVAMTDLEYSQVRVRDGFRCTRCAIKTMQGAWHHRRSKSVRDEMTHSAVNGIWTCTPCHLAIHSQPLLARDEGFIVSRFANPASTPCHSAQYGWVLYLLNGGYRSVDAPV